MKISTFQKPKTPDEYASILEKKSFDLKTVSTTRVSQSVLNARAVYKYLKRSEQPSTAFAIASLIQVKYQENEFQVFEGLLLRVEGLIMAPPLAFLNQSDKEKVEYASENAAEFDSATLSSFVKSDNGTNLSEDFWTGIQLDQFISVFSSTCDPRLLNFLNYYSDAVLSKILVICTEIPMEIRRSIAQSRILRIDGKDYNSLETFDWILLLCGIGLFILLVLSLVFWRRKVLKKARLRRVPASFNAQNQAVEQEIAANS